ncbi:MAG: Uncharacterized protein G01um10147_709 [Microgenomates group bacterium Gr01-1014_7]|nr:MAG: Uncharacterized protein G01um10147_709 [Microgenomates group bacterium Gr01-1014_7]
MNIKIITIITIIIIITVILPSAAFAATLSVSPTSGTFNKGCGFALTVTLDAQSADTDGTDAILVYDPTRFTATSILNGTIYSDYPGSNIDSTTGRVTISGLASVASAFSGKGTLATINFTVLEAAPAGATAITFDFDPNNKAKTTDSNVVQRGTVADVLSSVGNGSYTIGAGSCASPTPGPAVVYLPQGQTGIATPSAGYRTIDNLVDQTGRGPGTPELTFAIAIIGSVLTVLGILGLAFL